jgi:hypothetical protein
MRRAAPTSLHKTDAPFWTAVIHSRFLKGVSGLIFPASRPPRKPDNFSISSMIAILPTNRGLRTASPRLSIGQMQRNWAGQEMHIPRFRRRQIAD